MVIDARSDSDGLHVAREFYKLGHQDTRKRLRLHDAELKIVFEGPSERVRQSLNDLAVQMLERDDVTEVLWSVTRR